MTTNPGNQSYNLDALKAAQEEAQRSQVVAGDVVAGAQQRKIAVGRRAYNVVPELSPADIAAITDAQESGNMVEIIRSFGRLVRKSERQEFVDYILGDPDDDADRVSFRALSDQVNTHIEELMGRP